MPWLLVGDVILQNMTPVGGGGSGEKGQPLSCAADCCHVSVICVPVLRLLFKTE